MESVAEVVIPAVDGDANNNDVVVEATLDEMLTMACDKVMDVADPAATVVAVAPSASPVNTTDDLGLGQCVLW